jgi:hypothetical protein
VLIHSRSSKSLLSLKLNRLPKLILPVYLIHKMIFRGIPAYIINA